MSTALLDDEVVIDDDVIVEDEPEIAEEPATEDELEAAPEWALERARNGASWLDSKFGPDWDREIDLERLEIGSPRNCICGQLVRQGHLSLLFFVTRPIQHGFSLGLRDLVVTFLPIAPFMRAYRPLNDAWKVVLRERRGH